MNKGKLIYKTPKNASHNLAITYAFTLLGILPWLAIMIYVVSNFNKIQLRLGLETFLVFGFLFILSLFVILKGDEALNPHFKIYSNGITKPLRPLKVFFGSDETFIPFSQIKAFETELTSKEGQSVIYYEPKKRINYAYNKNVISYLNKMLKKQEIIKISSNCPNCKKGAWGYYNCPYCKSKRW